MPRSPGRAGGRESTLFILAVTSVTRFIDGSVRSPVTCTGALSRTQAFRSETPQFASFAGSPLCQAPTRHRRLRLARLVRSGRVRAGDEVPADCPWSPGHESGVTSAVGELLDQ